MLSSYRKDHDWFFRHPELTRNEAILLCEVMRWPNGCHKSSRRLAKDLKFHPRTVQRIIKRLVERQWLAVLYEGQMRILYVTPKEPPVGPLFDYKEKALKKVGAKNDTKV